MEIENLMKYAINLSDVNSHHEFEDLFKLASLCDEIEILKENGEQTDRNLDIQFRKTIKNFYKSNGRFRQEVERFAHAKQLIQGI
jgi:hypothetical protein